MIIVQNVVAAVTGGHWLHWHMISGSIGVQFTYKDGKLANLGLKSFTIHWILFRKSSGFGFIHQVFLEKRPKRFTKPARDD